jgi:hypothetical protein
MKKSFAFLLASILAGSVAHADTPRLSQPLISVQAAQALAADPVCAQLARAGGPSAVWSLSANEDIKTTLSRWASEAGWHAIWNAPIDWKMPPGQAATFQGNFAAASCALLVDLQAANGSRWTLHGQWFLPNKMLLVTARDKSGN